MGKENVIVGATLGPGIITVSAYGASKAAQIALARSWQAENAKISATLRAHDQLIQTLRLRIAKLKKQVFGQSSEKIEREIEQLELALEDLLIASAESETAAPDGDLDGAAFEDVAELHLTGNLGQDRHGVRVPLGHGLAGDDLLDLALRLRIGRLRVLLKVFAHQHGVGRAPRRSLCLG